MGRAEKALNPQGSWPSHPRLREQNWADVKSADHPKLPARPRTSLVFARPLWFRLCRLRSVCVSRRIGFSLLTSKRRGRAALPGFIPLQLAGMVKFLLKFDLLPSPTFASPSDP